MNSQDTQVTKEASEFVFELRYEVLPAEALRIGKRCILDGLGLILAGSSQECSQIVRKYCKDMASATESTIFGKDPVKVSAALAALVNGTAGHAMDWDDTQVSVAPDRMYGLLTHPTIPPLTACLAVSERLGHVSGKMFLTAFLAGFEVECKIAEAISPDHYKKGFHTSGTIGTFGAAIAAAKLLNLDTNQLRHAIGIAASMGAGIRANFGTMTKPLHVGRAAHNGVTAATLAASGFEANMDALDGPWGFFQVLGRGFDPEKIAGCFGNPHTIVDPGVSIKPYPCGVLTHPSMDAMLAVVVENDLKPDDIENVVLYAGTNILNPIRYQVASDELEAKFCMPFLLCAIAISRKAGAREFTPEFVNSPHVQALMRRIRTEFDPAIEAKGWDKIRSRVEITLKDGRKFVREADERYRGGPDYPLSEEELRAKFTDCTDELLKPETREHIFKTIATLEHLDEVEKLISLARTPA
ncbi:MAG: MmgE/PrpD family protein [Proteobacteria bacterium]|nr:MmgE/PrpD family protein [Pseudomonadota bacterium]